MYSRNLNEKKAQLIKELDDFRRRERAAELDLASVQEEYESIITAKKEVEQEIEAISTSANKTKTDGCSISLSPREQVFEALNEIINNPTLRRFIQVNLGNSNDHDHHIEARDNSNPQMVEIYKGRINLHIDTAFEDYSNILNNIGRAKDLVKQLVEREMYEINHPDFSTAIKAFINSLK